MVFQMLKYKIIMLYLHLKLMNKLFMKLLRKRERGKAANMKRNNESMVYLLDVQTLFASIMSNKCLM